VAVKSSPRSASPSIRVLSKQKSEYLKAQYANDKIRKSGLNR